jgi:hypothetical protein
MLSSCLPAVLVATADSVEMIRSPGEHLGKAQAPETVAPEASRAALPAFADLTDREPELAAAAALRHLLTLVAQFT